MKNELTRKQIDRIGEQIAKSTGEVPQEVLDQLQEYRKTFKEPLASVFSVLQQAANKVDSQCIVTYRIKRINTIIRKLRRFVDDPNGRMALSSIGDIAGCRCIITKPDENKIYQLRDLLVETYGENIIVSDKHDYVRNPKKSGYRSLHLYVKDPVSKRKVEIQIRTLEQHNWATLVEIIDLVFSKKIKEGQISPRLQRFLFLFSKKDNLSQEEIEEIIKIEKQKSIYKKMCKVFGKNYLNIRKQWSSRERHGVYFVIEADKDLKSSINAFNHYEEAETMYYEKYVQCKESNVVLIHVKKATFDQISKAYSNYILAMHSFFDDYKSFIEKQVLDGIKKVSRIQLWQAWKLYRKNTVLYVDTLKAELNELKKCAQDRSITKKHRTEWEKDLLQEIRQWQKNTNNFLHSQAKEIKGDKVSFLIIKCQLWLLSKQL